MDDNYDLIHRAIFIEVLSCAPHAHLPLLFVSNVKDYAVLDARTALDLPRSKDGCCRSPRGAGQLGMCVCILRARWAATHPCVTLQQVMSEGPHNSKHIFLYQSVSVCVLFCVLRLFLCCFCCVHEGVYRCLVGSRATCSTRTAECYIRACHAVHILIVGRSAAVLERGNFPDER